jgi:hypothetical protein
LTSDWRKSSFSGSQAECVEVGTNANRVLIRDTNDRSGVMLAVDYMVWSKFIGRMK